MNKKTTIKDIAKKANVSIATVSRVLRRTDYPVSQDVKKRVFDAADELEYKPNLFGRMLRGDASIEIGIIVPSINNPFQSRIGKLVSGNAGGKAGSRYIADNNPE